MPKKQKKGGGKGGGSPDFCSWPYLVAMGVLVAALAVYSAYYSPPDHSGQASRSSRGASIAQMEMQLQRMHDNMQGIASGGKTPVFTKIKGMADAVGEVLRRAREAETDEERRRILEEGLASKTDMLAALSDHATKLQADDEVDRQENAPLTIDGSTAVAKLTKDSFVQFIAENRRCMVEFYAPWCGHCKKLAPEYEKVAEQFNGSVGFAAVDGTEETQLARIYKVSGYPALKWFIRDRPIDYVGPRTAEHISKWVEERLQPAFAEVGASDDLSAALEQHGSSEVAICAGAGTQGSQAFAAFEAAAEELRGKMVFVWAEGGDESIRFLSKGKEPQACKGKSTPSCSSAEDVVTWLEDALAELEFGDVER